MNERGMDRWFMAAVGLLVLIALLLNVLDSRAADVTVCRDPAVEWVRFRFYGVDWAADNAPWYLADGASFEGNTLVADALPDGTAQVGVWLGEEYQVVTGTPETPFCGSPEAEPFEGDAPSIPVGLTSDCAFVEVIDSYGNWHRVESEGVPVLMHYGDSLIAGRDQSLAAEDYRAVATACY